MSHRSLNALLVMILLGAAAPATAAAQAAVDSTEKPAVIRLFLDRDRYDAGDLADALVTTRADGYVVVLQMDADRVAHVIFPASPGADAFVRAGDMAVRGPRGRYSFVVTGAPGAGLVYAAFSRVPFQFASFTRRGKWAISSEDSSRIAADPEPALEAVAERMSGGAFDDDLVQYEVLGADGIVAAAPPEVVATTDPSITDCAPDYQCGVPYGGVLICGGCGDPQPPEAYPPPPPPKPPLNLGGPATAPRHPYPDPPRVDPAPPSAGAPAPAAPRPPLPPLIQVFAHPAPTAPPPPPAPPAPAPVPRFDPPRVELHPAPPPPPPPPAPAAPATTSPPAAPPAPPSLVKPPHSSR